MRKFYATLLIFMALCCASLYSPAANSSQNPEPIEGSESIEVTEGTENPDPENPDNPESPGNHDDDIKEPEEPVKKSEFNALKIVLNADGNETEHFIAIDGNNLKLSVKDNVIKLKNSKLGVKYDIDEISHFIPVRYEFEDDNYFVGEHDINTGIDTVKENPLVLSLDGDLLFIKGVKGKQSVRMYSVSGLLVASAYAENGIASFRASSLERGVYLMNVDGKSIKVLIGR